MIQPQTLLNVADNSGARKLMCIRVIGAAGNQRNARIGAVIVFLFSSLSFSMRIINSVIVVGLYYGFLTTFSIGPS